MFKILKLNEISPKVTSVLNADNYSVSSECDAPDAIILRSFNMHDYPLPSSVQAVARAGAGVNNIPVEEMTKKGVCVFNTPGANANAVKELVIAAMLLSSRKIHEAINWTQALDKSADVAKLVEKGKKAFVGPEISGKTLGVVGLGAIGRLVANAAIELDMNVVGYDPFLDIDGALTLEREVCVVSDLKQLYSQSDYITLHVPATPQTNNSINKETIACMKTGAVVINLARAELINNADAVEAIKSGKLAKYVTDLPCAELLGIDNVITIPHLGASTPEAEDNCALMSAKELKDYLENGNVTNSVNFPSACAPRTTVSRVAVLHKNVANMIAKATSYVAGSNINISNLVSASRGEVGYMLLDLDGELPASVIAAMNDEEGFYRIKVYH